MIVRFAAICSRLIKIWQPIEEQSMEQRKKRIEILWNHPLRTLPQNIPWNGWHFSAKRRAFYRKFFANDISNMHIQDTWQIILIRSRCRNFSRLVSRRYDDLINRRWNSSTRKKHRIQLFPAEEEKKRILIHGSFLHGLCKSNFIARLDIWHL